MTYCHSFNVTDCDDVTFIVFTAYEPSNSETLNNRKTTRQLFMYKPYNGFLLQSRLYNTHGGTCGAQAESKLHRDLIQRELSELEGVPNLWKTEKYCGNKQGIHIACGNGFGGYADWPHPDFDAKISIRNDHANDFKTFTVGTYGLCISCGYEISNGLFCDDCDHDDCELCQECENYASETWKVFNRRGEVIRVCESCLDEHYRLCEHCNEYYPRDTLTGTNADGDTLLLCQACRAQNRCGVFALVKVYKSARIKPWLFFTCEEEVGSIGAKYFCLAHKQKQLPKNLDKLKLIIEIDRRGSDDAVFYQCANIDFEKYIIGKGFKTAQGSFSDISLVAPELGIAAVNLSRGYYNAHSLHEYIIRAELESTIEKVCEIVADAAKPDFPKFVYVENFTKPYHSKKIRYYDDLSTFYSEQDNLPQKIPSEYQDIYEALLDFYSLKELESFRADYGDQILWQIYSDEIAPYY